MPLPQAVRRLAPDRLRYSVRVRALAVGSGLVPPRSMHSPAESALLAELARDRRTAVEIGVYEGPPAGGAPRAPPAPPPPAPVHPVSGSPAPPPPRGRGGGPPRPGPAP